MRLRKLYPTKAGFAVLLLASLGFWWAGCWFLFSRIAENGDTMLVLSAAFLVLGGTPAGLLIREMYYAYSKKPRRWEL